MILKDKLARLLARQDIGDQMEWATLESEWKEEYYKNADDIIKLIVSAHILQPSHNRLKP